MSSTLTKLAMLGLVVTLVTGSCGDNSEPALSSEGKTVPSRDAGWWLLDHPEFRLVDGHLANATAGQVWVLEYSSGRKTLQLSAWETDSGFVEMVNEDPAIGTAELDGLDVTLRQGRGIPSDDIPPSVGAFWVDTFFLSFGGGDLSEVDVRDYLTGLRRVSRREWERALEGLPPPPPAPETTDLN